MGVNEIQVGRYNAILHKLLDMKEGAPAPTLAPEVLAAIVLEQDPPEFGFLGNTKHCAAYSAQAAGGAGAFGNSVLENLPNSNVLLVPRRAWFLNITGGTAICYFTLRIGASPTYDASANGVWVDTRASTVVARASAVVGERAQVASLGGTAIGALSASSAYLAIPWDAPRVVLRPGSQLIAQSSQANDAFYVMWEWRERALEASETR